MSCGCEPYVIDSLMRRELWIIDSRILSANSALLWLVETCTPSQVQLFGGSVSWAKHNCQWWDVSRETIPRFVLIPKFHVRTLSPSEDFFAGCTGRPDFVLFHILDQKSFSLIANRVGTIHALVTWHDSQKPVCTFPSVQCLERPMECVCAVFRPRRSTAELPKWVTVPSSLSLSSLPSWSWTAATPPPLQPNLICKLSPKQSGAASTRLRRAC